MSDESAVRRATPESAVKRSPDEATDGSPSLAELKRIVEVAEELKICPQTARIALQDGNGRIPTGCRLGRSVALVEKALEPGR